MDQELLNQLRTLAQLQLPPDLVREILEHEKWMLKERQRHELEMAGRRKEKEARSEKPSPDSDSESFNSSTSNGQCGREHIGLLAKSKVAAGAAMAVRSLPGSDKHPPSLLSLLLTISWCGDRLDKWPEAKDSKSADTLLLEFTKAVDKHGVVQTVKGVDFIVDSIPAWNDRIIVSVLPELRSEAKTILASTFSSSPLFAEFQKEFPYVTAEEFDTCYNSFGCNFVESGIHVLRYKFKFHAPKEYSHIEGWNQRWPQYLPHYLKVWQNDLKAMENRMRVAQRAWKESTS